MSAYKDPGMTPARLDAILARQVPDAEKRRRADHLVRTGLGRHAADRAVRALLRRLQLPAAAGGG